MTMPAPSWWPNSPRVLADHTYRRRADQFVTAADDAATRPKVALRIGPPNRIIADQWGDTHFARALRPVTPPERVHNRYHDPPRVGRPRSPGCRCRRPPARAHPVLPQPAHLNVLWIISHPDEVSVVECERFDMVMVASEPFARMLRDKVDVPGRGVAPGHRLGPVRPLSPPGVGVRPSLRGQLEPPTQAGGCMGGRARAAR